MLTLLLAMAAAHAAPVTVTVTGLRSDTGVARVFVWTSPKGFPMDEERASAVGTGPISGGVATVSLADVPAGTVALSVIHDEDGDGELDTNWIGMPREGVGASTPPGFKSFGPPGFEDARFEVGADPVARTIEITYLL